MSPVSAPASAVVSPDGDWMQGTFAALQVEHPDVAEQAERLSEGYRLLILAVDPALSTAGVYDRPDLAVENIAQRSARERLFAYEQQINDEALYTGEGLSLFADVLRRALELLHPLLQGLRTAPTGPGGDVVDAYVHTAQRLRGLLDRFDDLPLIQAGRATRRAQAAAETARARVGRGVAAVRRIIDQHRRSGGGSGTHGIFGTLVAKRLVHDLRMDATEVRQVLDELERRDPELLEAALFGGQTVRALLSTGQSGFQQYRSQGEGFLSGVVRGSREDRLAQPPGNREFSVGEQAEAVAWFFLGAAEGIGRTLIDNVKDVLSLFTPAFWRSLRNFLLNFVPDFLSSTELRFELGQRMGRFDTSEERRLATADADVYGRTVGVIFGYGLTETVLSFLGLGWVLKSLSGSARLGRLSAPLARAAGRIGPAAVAAAGLRRMQALAASLQALTVRLRGVTRDLRVPSGASRAATGLDEATALERRARVALGAGDEAGAQRHIDELGAVLHEVEGRARAARGSGQTGPPAASPPDRAAGATAAASTPSSVGPAAHIPANPGAFVERGIFRVTERPSFIVRAGPAGKYGDHMFDSLEEALQYARSASRRGESNIRETSALPRIWPGGAQGNPVDAVRVFEVPPNTPYIQGVVGPQLEGGTVFGAPKTYLGGGPQVAVDWRAPLVERASFPVLSP